MKDEHEWDKRINAEGDWVLGPKGTSAEALERFTEAVRHFLVTHPEYELLIHHTSSAAGVGLWDQAIIRPPEKNP